MRNEMVAIVEFTSVMLVALLVGTSFAHSIEMPAKMKLSAIRWLDLQHTLYRSFATIGGVVEIAAIVATAALAYLVRGDRASLLLTGGALLCVAIAFFVVWLGFTQPVNGKTAVWTTKSIPMDWARWRSQWEYSHLVRFALHLLALGALVANLVRAGAG